MILTKLHTHRRGLTLTEVLVAMFVMALGMISLLTLFPLGAMQVGQALRDDRATQTAHHADAFIRQAWRHNVIPLGSYPTTTNIEPMVAALDDPNLESRVFNFTTGTVFSTYIGSSTQSFPAPYSLGVGALPQTTVSSPLSQSSLTLDQFVSTPAGTAGHTAFSNFSTLQFLNIKSYPVFVDPHGEHNYPAPTAARRTKLWAGGDSGNPVAAVLNNTLFLPRRQLLAVTLANAATKPQLVLDLGGMTDDMTFQPNGTPVTGQLGRQGRYTWGAIIQRPRNDIRDVADLQVLVFDRRVMPPLRGDEYVMTPDAAAAVGDRQVTVTVPKPDPETGSVLIRRGGWIMDGTLEYPATATSRRNAHFYRIAALTETGETATTITYVLDLETPLKDSLTSNTSRLYLFAGLIEVFQRPQLRPDVSY